MSTDPGEMADEINRLNQTISELTEQRDDLINRSYQTVFFACGCIFKQDGLDDEPRLMKHCTKESVDVI